MASSFIWELSNKYLNLTPTEIRIAELLKKGRRTKEIAEEIGVAPSTINTHRESLRRKLGLTGKDINLATFLRTLK
jgi:DNA-binding CsgD family transcriptional regulator